MEQHCNQHSPTDSGYINFNDTSAILVLHITDSEVYNLNIVAIVPFYASR